MTLTDSITGRNVQLSMLYIIPHAMALWKNIKAIVYLLAILPSFVIVSYYLLWNKTEFLHFAEPNGVMKVTALYPIHILSLQTKGRVKSYMKK